jgi:hypothetical protein
MVSTNDLEIERIAGLDEDMRIIARHQLCAAEEGDPRQSPPP